MDVNSQSLKGNRQPRIFNSSERFIEGWYWVIPTQDVGIGDVKSITLLGRKLVIYRGENRQVVICDAHCPHMGAHLGEGTVEGNELRCALHHWKFNIDGVCVEIPCLEAPLPLKLKTWPTVERYGIVWIWTGEIPRQALPFVPELEFQDYESILGNRFVINCHPHLLMLNAIDAQHFQVIPEPSLDIDFEQQELNPNALIFSKYGHHHKNWSLAQIFRPLYEHPIYSICYWYGSTLTLTVGTDLQRFYLMLALRLIDGDKVEVQSVLLAKKRRGLYGWWYNRLMLWLSNFLVQQLVKDDGILQTMQFDFKTPTSADEPIMQLIDHVECQKPLMWKTWLLARSPDVQIKENQSKWRDEMIND